MTRDQMHNTLRYVREQLADERGSDFSGVKALDMVLEELEQEPCDDVVSIEAVIEWLKAKDIIKLFSQEETARRELKALPPVKQEPSGDLISRQAVLDELSFYLNDTTMIEEDIKKLPSINLQEPSVEIVKTEESNDNGTKYLNINVSDGEVKRNPDVVRLCSDVGILEYVKPSGDLVSRQAVQDYIAKYLSQYLYDDVREAVEVIDEYIGELPSVNPQEPKTGHWIHFATSDDCSECGWSTGKYISPSKYCPNCGVKMVKENEDELKDLSKRVEALEKQMIEDKEAQLEKLKAEIEYAKIYCALPTIGK